MTSHYEVAIGAVPATCGPPARQPKDDRRIRATYDSAKRTDENKRHWANADALSAGAANSHHVRFRLRTHARYERDNNSYCAGMVKTLANDLVGTGPRLQLTTSDSQLNRDVEAAFGTWADAVCLADKLRTMKQSKTVDGEAFALFTTNLILPNPVKLDLRLIECDQVHTPFPNIQRPNFVDGIEFDSAGNASFYHLLNQHPGDMWVQQPLSYQRIPAREMLHWFACSRPGQYRGIPEYTAALALFAFMRRFTLAAVSTAEIQACFTAFLKTQSAPVDAQLGKEFDTIDIVREMLMTLPAGHEVQFLNPSQPAPSYEMFKRELLNEIARCLNIPYNIAAGNSSSYNFASGRLDQGIYFQSMKVERSDIEGKTFLSRVFSRWLEEALLVPDYLPRGVSIADLTSRLWFWDEWAHQDPSKEAAAADTLIKAKLMTYAEWYAKKGKDWEDQFVQSAREQKLADKLGLDLSGLPAVQVAAPLSEADQKAQDEGSQDATPVNKAA